MTGLVDLPGGGSNQTATPPAITSTMQSGGLITPVAANDTDRAIQMLGMSDADRAQVQQAVKSGKAQLGWITLSDFATEDGDWVTISGAGFKQDVRLFKKAMTHAVPFTPGTPVTITGLYDPGGGITLNAHVGTATVGLKPIVRGESITVPTQ
jgi:hypothetical protein